MAVGLAALAAPACIQRSDADLSGRPLDGARPDVYGVDPALAPIVGGNGLPGDANAPLDPAVPAMAPNMGEEPNAIAFTAASALFVPASNGNDTGPTVYVYAQSATCTDLAPSAPARQGLVLQLQFSEKVAPGNYQVMAGTGDAVASMGSGQVNAALLNNGTSLLGGAVGEVVVSASSATSLELASLQLQFSRGQTLRLGQIEAQVCAVSPALVAPEKFVAAAAYFTQGAGGVGPILSLVDLPINCANLRSANVGLPDGASLLRIYFGDTALQGNYTLLAGNAVGSDNLAVGRAAARMSKPTVALGVTEGSVVLQNYLKDSQLVGTVTATLGDGSKLVALPFTATYCP